MNEHEKTLWRILRGGCDNDIAFESLRRLLLYLGFDERVKGSHHVFRRSGIMERVNIQRDGNKAKSYQVREVRRILLRYNLGKFDDA